MAKSIIQSTKECYICRLLADQEGYYGELPSTGLHKHHFVFGKGNRTKSEKFGLWGYICNQFHHEYGEMAVHNNRGIRIMLSQIAQRAFEEHYPQLQFYQEFGIMYVEPGEEFSTDVVERAKNGSKTLNSVSRISNNVQKSQKDAQKSEKSVPETKKFEFLETGLESDLPF